MSDRAREFLDDFVAGLQATGTQVGSDSQAYEVVQTAIVEASQNNITADELKSAADGDLTEYFRNALPSEDEA